MPAELDKMETRLLTAMRELEGRLTKRLDCIDDKMVKNGGGLIPQVAVMERAHNDHIPVCEARFMRLEQASTWRRHVFLTAAVVAVTLVGNAAIKAIFN